MATKTATLLGEARGFRLDVQGLRAIAVISVILFHYDLGKVSGGYVGVDVFFVISGYIITTQLRRAIASGGKGRLRSFYGARARRILPAGCLVLVVTVLLSYHYLGYISGAGDAHDATWAALFAANIHFAHTQTAYSNANGPASTVLQYWSLGVEEQFYVVWPALLFGLTALATRHGRGARSRPLLMLAIIFTASLVWSIVQTADAGTVAYYSPLTRAWEFAVGAAIAFLPVSSTTYPTLARFAKVIGWLGLAGVLLAAFSYTQQTAFPGYAALLPVLGAGAIIFAGAYDGRFSVGRLLSVLPLRFIGDISFSLYLWHWPLITIAKEVSLTGRISTAATFELLALALGLAVATFFLVEQPFRRSSLLRRRGALPSFALGAFLVLAVVCLCRIEIVSHPPVASTTERGVNLLNDRSNVV
jgi:peptidoglycan/LPS O-acetylase OafA/YrhL